MMFLDHVLLLTLVAASCIAEIFCGNLFFDEPKDALNPTILFSKPVWRTGEEGISAYRIPLIAETPINGYLLAFAEARKFESADDSLKNIVQKTSRDRGLTWTSNTIIFDSGNSTEAYLGAVLVDQLNYRVLLFFSFCDDCLPKSRQGTWTTYMLVSGDEGESWSQPRNISQFIGTEVLFALGPGHGVQKKFRPHIGRLVICGYKYTSDFGLNCYYSDDNGTSWGASLAVPGIPVGSTHKKGDFVSSEVDLVELPDGSIVVNARNSLQYHCPCRIIFISRDGAETFSWKDIRLDTALIEPVCSAGMDYSDVRDIMVFTNPASSLDRVNMTLRWSMDRGLTWAGSLQLWEAASCYSVNTFLRRPRKEWDEQRIVILHEAGFITCLDFIMITLVDLSGAIFPF